MRNLSPAGRLLILALIVFASSLALIVFSDPGMAAEQRRITLEAAFGRPNINGRMPGMLRISPDDDWVLATWADDAMGYSELWLFSMDGSKRIRLTDTKDARRRKLAEENEEIEDEDDRLTEEELEEKLEREQNYSQAEWDKDGRHAWIVYRGDLYRLDAFDTGEGVPEMEKILSAGSWIGDIKFSEDGRYLGIALMGEIWIRDLENGALLRLTTDATGGKVNYGLKWSQSGRYLAFYQDDSSGIRTTYMADFLTENVNPIPLTRARPGDQIGKGRFGVIDLEAEDEPEPVFIETDDDDEIYGMNLVWAPDTDRLLIAKTKKDLETWSVWEVVDFGEGKAVKLFEYTDEAWVNDAFSDLFWGPDADSFVTLLEKSGYSHVYLVDFRARLEGELARLEDEKRKEEEAEKSGDESSIELEPAKDAEDTELETAEEETDEDDEEIFPRPVQLTFGEYEVTWLEMMKDRRTAYIITSIDGPPYRAIEKLDIPSRGRKRLSIERGQWSFSTAWSEGIRISDSERIALAYKSDFGRPSALYRLDLERARARLVFDPRPPDWHLWRWVIPEHITYMNTEHPGRVHALLYLPPYHEEGDVRPLVVQIHGAGYAQGVQARQMWMDGIHTYMADTLGYVVLVVDYRGSSGYGRDWRVAVDGWLGEIEDSDARAGVEYLKRSGIVDPELVGIWGWSYGGFQTNYSMLRSPEVWKVGVAMAAVNDWANYNHWYSTSRLDNPEDDPEPYKRSATITYADGLEGDLLMVHGLLDSNVMAQDFMQLAAELIDNNKEFDMFVFPADGHGLYARKRTIYFMKMVAGYFDEHFGRGPGAAGVEIWSDGKGQR